MNVQLTPILKADMNTLENMFQLYLCEMSRYGKWAIEPDGLFKFDENILKDYFNQPHHYPYFIMVDGELSGFSLVRPYPYRKTIIDMGQFFVLPKFARLGIGKAAFKLTLDKHPGDWQVRVLPVNLSALKFWEKTIEEITDKKYLKSTDDYQGSDMKFFHFDNGK